MRDKTANFRVGQKSWFWKRDKIAQFDNETKLPILKWDKTVDLYRNGDRTKQSILNKTKPPISKMRENRRFCKREQTSIKMVSDKSLLA